MVNKEIHLLKMELHRERQWSIVRKSLKEAALIMKEINLK